jgi:methanethiol S-methyltransferase
MLLLFLAGMLWGGIHSLLASVTVKQWAQDLVGPRKARFYRFYYNLFSGISFLVILVIAYLTPDRRLYSIPQPWSLIMIIGELLAVIILVAGLRQTDVWEFIGIRQLLVTEINNSSKARDKKVDGRLVTSGVYRYVRHPLYSAGIAFIWLLPVMTTNVFAINLAMTIYVVIGAYFEERKLRTEFGKEYADYADLTPMFIPFIKGNKKS